MKLMVVILDRFRTEFALTYENQAVPYGRRIVSIELTKEQSEALRLRELGVANGQKRFEEVGEVWLEGGPEKEM